MSENNGIVRGTGGKFAKGTAGGPGPMPGAERAKSLTLRRALLEAVTEEDIHEIALKLLGMAKAGDIAAIKELLDRCIGKARFVAEVEAETESGTKIIRLAFDDRG